MHRPFVQRPIFDLNRRAFLGSIAATAGPWAWGALAQSARADEAALESGAGHYQPYPGVIARQRNPDNLEFPFPTLNSFLTPNEQFYVRSHFEVPTLEARNWKLKIEGQVEHPFEIGYDEIRKMNARTVTSLLECAGNSRVLLKPPQGGIRWEQGGVSNAEWTGVPLAAVLERAGLKTDAVDVIFEGADKGELRSPDPRTPGKINFARSLPVKKARQQEVLLAWKMNGHDLPVEHGFPVRLIVPGWYGMASVKWLTRIRVSDRPFHGFFQTFSYSKWERRGGIPDLVPVTDLEVKSQIAHPTLHEVVSADSKFRVFGAAWAGEADVKKVEVSTDGGKRWSEARLLDKPVRYAWRLWEYPWKVPAQAGKYTLMVRATDDRGRVQPMERDDDRRDGVISQVQATEVLVR